jgi:hypothetical protein
MFATNLFLVAVQRLAADRQFGEHGVDAIGRAFHRTSGE